MRWKISLFFFFLCVHLSHAQVLLDSLEQLHPDKYFELRIDEAVSKNDFDAVAKYYEDWGKLYFSKNKKEDALKYYTKSIHYYGILDDSLNYYRINIDIADYYFESRLFPDALKIREQALRFFEREKIPTMQMLLCTKIAEVYRMQNKREQVRYFLEKGLQTNKIVKDTTYEIQGQLQKAKIYEETGKYSKAIAAAYKASEYSKQSRDTTNLSHALLRLGIIYNYLEEKDTSFQYLEFGDSLFQKKPFAFPSYSDYKDISDAFISFGEPQKAYNYLIKYVAQKDSSFNTVQQTAINEIIAQYQQDEQERELHNLQISSINADIRAKQQRTIIYSFLVGFLVILTALYYTIRFYQQKISAKEIIVQQKEEINRQRIVDLENNLKIETMQSMLAGQEAERERVAKDLHDSLGGLLSTIKLQYESVEGKLKSLSKSKEYQKANIMLDEACQEVRNISNNMQPGALMKLGLVPAIKDLTNRFQDDHYPDIDFQHYGLNKNLDTTMALMVFRIIQELLNNSIKYAKANEILIQLTRNAEEKELIVMVEDDGIGYDIEQVKKGMGTENINSRVNYLKGDLSVHSVIGKGTSTMINIPL